MKKFLKTIVIISVIIGLICLVQKLGILDFSNFDISVEQLANYSEHYFNKLDLDEKKMYVRIDEALKNKQEKVFLGFQNSDISTGKISEVLTAYFYDNPQYYYVSNQYLIKTNDLKILKFSEVQFEYTTKSNSEIELKNTELKIAIDTLLNSCINDNMTDFEKELAIHDALVEHVTYYDYEDIDKIPSIKHTAYGALVEKEAVCDGYAKAFKMLLQEVGIDSIIVSGTTDNTAHAWNIVNLEDKYYHVDVTSDKLEQGNNKYVIHKYFNITDDELMKTHTINKKFKYPECNFEKYNYYINKNFYLKYTDNIGDKLKNIIAAQEKSDVLELKAHKSYTSKDIIDTLYNLNFDNWRFSGKTSIEYSQMQDVYAFIK